MRPLRLLPISLLGALTLFAAIPGTAEARKPGMHGGRMMMQRPLVSLAVVGSDGMAMRQAMHRGRTFIAGEHGERYEIKLTNNTSQRLEVVVAVDGRDVVSGELGNFRTQRGYVLSPMGTVTIDGFRRSMEHVAAFRFSGVRDSYAGRRGTASNAGIIGIAVFKERMAAPLAQNEMRRDRFAPGATSSRASKKKARPRAGAADSSMRAPEMERQELGTKFGETMRSSVRRVSFTRQNAMRPDFRLAVRYDSARALARRGVPIEPRPVAVPMDAFPSAQAGFAPPPPMRRRR
jgi:hypothetical protein